MLKWLRRKKGLDQNDPQSLLKAIHGLDDEQAHAAQARLGQLALGDSDHAVRRAATARLQNPDALLDLLDDAVVGSEARTGLMHKLAQETLALDHDPRLTPLCLQHGSTAVITQLRTQLGAQITDAQSLAHLVLALRQDQRKEWLTDPVLRDESGLSTLEKASRAKDKTLNRYARQELETLRSGRRELVDANRRLQEIDSAIQRELAEETPATVAKIKHLLTQRDDQAAKAVTIKTKLQDFAVETPEIPELAQREALMSRLDTADTDAAETPEDPPAEVVKDLPESPFPSLVEACAALQESLNAEPLNELTRSQFDALQTQWRLHALDVSPTDAQNRVFDQTTALLQRRETAEAALAEADLSALTSLPSMDDLGVGKQMAALRDFERRGRQVLKRCAWPKELARPSELAALDALLIEAKAQTGTLQTKLEELDQQMLAQLQLGDEALQGGESKRALQAIRQARDLQKQGVSRHDKRLNTLSGKLKELQDWQNFATAPKRQELLTDLQQIASQPLEPEAQADRLRFLRGEWNALGNPKNAGELALQQRFDSLADEAFKHCEAHFAAKSALRAHNLAERQALCEQLRVYLENTDWERADMAAAEHIMRTARDEWRNHHPCDRRPLKPVQADFERLQQQLHEKVKGAWDANVAAKRQIIEEANALLEQDDNHAQVESAKQLQHRWRSIGKTPRGVDQRLWREFRSICDNIFSQRDASRQAAHEARQADFAAVDAALDQLAQSFAAQPPTASAFKAGVAAIHQAAGETRLSRAQQQRLRDLEERFDQARAQQSQQAEVQLIAQLQTWDVDVSAWEAQASESEQAAPHPWFEARIRGQAEPADWLRLTLEAEIAAQIESPNEAQARMALQIELINEGRKPASEDYKTLLKQWCQAGPKTDCDPALSQRFFAAIRARA